MKKIYIIIIMLMMGPYVGNIMATVITVELKDSYGNHINSGATLRYFDNAWKTNALNNYDGTWTINTSATALFYEMTFNNGKQTTGLTSATITSIVFQTTATTVRLQDQAGTGFTGGIARYSQTTWNDLGTTGISGNSAPLELLPGTYSFEMTYNNGKQQIGPLAVSGPAKLVTFTTTTVTVRLESSAANGIDGGLARFYQSSWINMGNTGAGGQGNTVSADLLPGNYYFDMTYANAKQQIGTIAISGASQVVTFKTTGVTVKLVNSKGAGLSGGIARYSQTSWIPISNTDSGGNSNIELLPGSYSFDMTINNGKQKLGPVSISGTTQLLTFATVFTTIRLENCSHTGFQNGVTRYYQWGWNNLPNTGQDGNSGIELLPGNYSFDMDYNFTHQQYGPVTIAPDMQNVVFQTTAVSLGGNGTTEYYQSAWHTFTGTINLLPGSIYLRVGGNQAGPVNISGCTYNQTLIGVRLINHLGSGIAGAKAQQYINGYQDISGSTNSDGYVFAMVPTGQAIMTFSMTYAYGRQEKSFYIQTSPVAFQTQLVRVTLKDHKGNPLSGTMATDKAQYFVGGWHDIGTLNGISMAFIELLPVHYSFSMNYSYARQETSQDISANPVVVFQTSLVDVSIQDHLGGSTLTGCAANGDKAQYYCNGWKDFPSFDGQTHVSKELLPVSYPFNINYAFASQQTAQNTALNPNVVFKTSLVIISLQDGNFNPLNGSARYYAAGWRALPPMSGGQTTIELLPATYSFSMSYLTSYREKSASTGIYAGNVSFVYDGILKDTREIPAETAGVTSLYPNPFQNLLNIKFTLSDEGRVIIRCFDIAGALKSEILNEVRPAGTYSEQWGSSLPAGVYVIVVVVNGVECSRKVVKT